MVCRYMYKHKVNTIVTIEVTVSNFFFLKSLMVLVSPQTSQIKWSNGDGCHTKSCHNETGFNVFFFPFTWLCNIYQKSSMLFFFYLAKIIESRVRYRIYGTFSLLDIWKNILDIWKKISWVPLFYMMVLFLYKHVMHLTLSQVFLY